MRRTLTLRPATAYFVESYPGLVFSQGTGGDLHPGGRQLAADLLRPVSAEPVPLVVFLKGGGFRNQWRAKYLPQLVPLAQAGVAVASIDYRTSNEAHFPAQLHDAKAAVRWFRANAARLGIDPGRIGVWGNSAGGTLAALLGTTDSPDAEGTGDHLDQSSTVQAVVDWYGVTDLATMPGADEPGSTVSQLLGGTARQHPDLARAASAVHQVAGFRSALPPFLVVHGDTDSTVPPRQSEALVEALATAGADVTHVVVQDAGHSFSTISMRSDALAMTTDFLVRHLSLDATGQQAA